MKWKLFVDYLANGVGGGSALALMHISMGWTPIL